MMGVKIPTYPSKSETEVITMNRELLEKPFAPQQIKQRQGNYGHILDYVEGHAVIARLNQAFDGNWTYELVDHRILEETGEVLVLGRLATEGITKMAFGSKRITRDKETKSIISLGDDLKAASTDALKKTASLLGVGLYLYADSRPKKTERGHPKVQDDRTTESSFARELMLRKRETRSGAEVRRSRWRNRGG